jgi:phage baseplate assembly protein gpV
LPRTRWRGFTTPTRITGFANDGIRLQSRDGGRHVWIKSSGEIIADNGAAQVRIAPDGDVNIENGAGHIRLLADGTVNINGATIGTDGILRAGDVVFGGISGKAHKHTNVQNGPNTSGGPTN